jgi:hypothetical protein
VLKRLLDGHPNVNVRLLTMGLERRQSSFGGFPEMIRRVPAVDPTNFGV